MKEFNTTQLFPYKGFERNILHRDLIAHVLRWTFVLRLANIGMNILDVGCGDGGLYETFYRNRYSPKRYLGLDIRKQTIDKNKVKYSKAEFQVQDLVKSYNVGKDWDIIASFEVAEHIQKKNVPAFLDNIANACNKNTVVLISTPCFNGKAAENHIYAGGPQELTYEEMEKAVSKRFDIVANYGTFASVKDYKKLLTAPQLELFEQLSDYYDSNLVSVIFAPLFPKQSRNVIWRLKVKV